MTDSSVAEHLRSDAPVIVVESPAGCGKTYQAADYARASAASIAPGRVLILTHTHAACDVIAAAAGAQKQVEVRTIDSFISLIGSSYHVALGLPPDVAAWARSRENGYAELATKVAALLQSITLVRALVSRYPLVICDEHQDSSPSQHAVVMALKAGGARLRIFGDPMQRIYKASVGVDDTALDKQWVDLTTAADVTDKLDIPHRWGNPPNELGKWILSARQLLKDGGSLDLTGEMPAGLELVLADNEARKFGDFSVAAGRRRPVSQFVATQRDLLVLTHQTRLVRGLNSFFGRSIPIWEGHVRSALDKLVTSVLSANGNPSTVANAATAFMLEALNGFQGSNHARVFKREVEEGCANARRGLPALLQELARCIVDSPDHRGVGRALRMLEKFIAERPEFRNVKIDLRREFWDAARLADFDDANAAVSEIAKVRAYARPSRPNRAISTIHKAKGLQCDAVLLLPCDRATFPDSPFARKLLYVALSRARHALMLVVPPSNPSPLLRLA